MVPYVPCIINSHIHSRLRYISLSGFAVDFYNARGAKNRQPALHRSQAPVMDSWSSSGASGVNDVMEGGAPQ